MTDSKRPRLLVTGATGGMGRATSLAAIAKGYDLLLADLDGDKLAALAAECSAAGANADWCVLDVTDAASVSALASAAAEGGIDGIVHTVGLSPTMAAGKRIVEVDLIGFIATLEALRPSLNAGGCAVCISSMSAHMVPPNAEIEALLADSQAPDLLEKLAALPGAPLDNASAAYPYSKKALINYVEARAGEWGREGKRLATISPGLIDTGMGKQEEAAGKDMYTWMETLIAMGRHGEPEEIASAALFLVSPAASYVSGIDLKVDGGFVGSFREMQRNQAG